MQTLDVDTLSAAVRAGHLALSMTDALVLRPEDSAGDAATRMAASQYSTAPVIADQGPVGVYTLSDAGDGENTGKVVDSMRPLSSRLIVASETPLSVLIERLRIESFLFVVGGSGITGFVTPADLGTVHVRTHFYLRLAHLEGMLGEYLRAAHVDQSEVVALLSASRREQQRLIADDLRDKDKFVDDIACLSLDDLVKVAGRDFTFRNSVKEAGVGWRRAIDGLADFRNDIMHATRPFHVSDTSRPGRLADRERGLDALIRATTVMVQSGNPASGAKRSARR